MALQKQIFSYLELPVLFCRQAVSAGGFRERTLNVSGTFDGLAAVGFGAGICSARLVRIGVI